MSLKLDIAAFEAKLYSAIESTLETDVLELAKEEIVEVLDEYDWTMSRGKYKGSGGLRDTTQIHGMLKRSPSEISITITDDADFQDSAINEGDTLAEVVTRGDKEYHMPQARPFMNFAEAELGNGMFSNELANGLKKRGYQIL